MGYAWAGEVTGSANYPSDQTLFLASFLAQWVPTVKMERKLLKSSLELHIWSGLSLLVFAKKKNLHKRLTNSTFHHCLLYFWKASASYCPQIADVQFKRIFMLHWYTLHYLYILCTVNFSYVLDLGTWSLYLSHKLDDFFNRTIFTISMHCCTSIYTYTAFEMPKIRIYSTILSGWRNQNPLSICLPYVFWLATKKKNLYPFKMLQTI